MSEQSKAEAELGLAKTDEYDLIGLQVAEILRKADSAAGELRSAAENHAAKVYAEADELRANAADERAEADRLHNRAQLKMEQAETRLATTEATLESAKAQAEELLAAARRERDAIVKETIREAQDQLTRATQHLQSRLKDIQRSQREAAERLTAALATLEALDEDLSVLDPDSVIDLTRSEPTVGPALSKSGRAAPSSEPVLDADADADRGAPDSDPAELRGTVDVAPAATAVGTTGEASASDGTWLGDVVHSAVSRAIEESDDADDSTMQRF